MDRIQHVDFPGPSPSITTAERPEDIPSARVAHLRRTSLHQSVRRGGSRHGPRSLRPQVSVPQSRRKPGTPTFVYPPSSMTLTPLPAITFSTTRIEAMSHAYPLIAAPNHVVHAPGKGMVLMRCNHPKVYWPNTSPTRSRRSNRKVLSIGTTHRPRTLLSRDFELLVTHYN
jgi:hypothetical protein